MLEQRSDLRGEPLDWLHVPVNIVQVTSEPLSDTINGPDPSRRAENRLPESDRTMVRGRMLLLSASCCLLVALGGCDEPPEERSAGDHLIKTEEEKALVSLELYRVRSQDPVLLLLPDAVSVSSD